MTNFNDLFKENGTANSNNARLQGTAKLVSICDMIAGQCMQKLSKNFEEYAELFEASTESNDAMDDLLDKLEAYKDVYEQADFLLDIDDDKIDRMLKSQQSKRSRAKSKEMSMTNYEHMMNGALAENIIRMVCNKPKNSRGNRQATVQFTPEELELLTADQEKLRRELRNVQSKKSIMKSRVDFSESSDKWQALLVAEAQLKDIRVSTRTVSIRNIDLTKDKLTELLKKVDYDLFTTKQLQDFADALAKLTGYDSPIEVFNCEDAECFEEVDEDAEDIEFGNADEFEDDDEDNE